MATAVESLCSAAQRSSRFRVAITIRGNCSEERDSLAAPLVSSAGDDGAAGLVLTSALRRSESCRETLRCRRVGLVRYDSCGVELQSEARLRNGKVQSLKYNGISSVLQQEMNAVWNRVF